MPNNDVLAQPKEKKGENGKRDRSSAYPSSSLSRAVEAIEDLNEKLGPGPYDRHTMARALGFSGVSGASASLIGTLVHFNLVDRTGNSYSRSSLAKRILKPVDDNERKEGLIIALHQPRLYESLLAEYGGQALPTMLANILTRKHGISEKAAPRAEAAFKESCEYAGVMQNGVLVLPENNEDEVEVRPARASGSPSVLNFSQDLTGSNASHLLPLAAGVALKIPLQLQLAFAMGEFGDEVKALQAKLKRWEEENKAGG